MSAQGGGLLFAGSSGARTDCRGTGSTALTTGFRLNREPIHAPRPKATSRSPVTTRIGRRFIVPRAPDPGWAHRCTPAVYQKGGASAGAIFPWSETLDDGAGW